jgi:hypothetical protein
MARPTFITGLPRSRTAWLAVVCSTATSICHHEPVDGDIRAARALWAAPGGWDYVGISEAFLGLHIARVLEEIGPRTLIVERDPDEVLASFLRYVGLQGVRGPGEHDGLKAQLRLLRERLDAIPIDHPLVRRVAYGDLEDRDAVQVALGWLMPGVELLNLDQMLHMNVQSDLSFSLGKLRNRGESRNVAPAIAANNLADNRLADAQPLRQFSA